MSAQTTPQTAQVRKIFMAGRSLAIVIPPVVLDHLSAERGDYIFFDTSVPRFAVISVAPLPPQFTTPDIFPPGTIEPPPQPPTQEELDIDSDPES